MATRLYQNTYLGTILADNEAPAFGFGAIYHGLAGNDTVSVSGSGTYGLGSGDDFFSVVPAPAQSLVFVRGSEGNDTISGTRVSDQLFGGSGNDSLVGNDGDDFLAGDCFDWVLAFCGWFGTTIESAGVDTILGGGGDDLIVGGPLGDSLDGGPGRNMFAWENADEFGDMISNFQVGAAGDFLFFNNLISAAPGTVQGDFVRFAESGANTIVQLDADGPGGAGFVDVATLLGVTASSILPSQVAGLIGELTLVPARFNFVASEWADTVTREFGGFGDPTLFYTVFTLGGNDTVSTDVGGDFNLGPGDDLFTAIENAAVIWEPPSIVNGGTGNDTINGAAYQDSLTGGSHDDSLVGNGGDDVLLGDCSDQALFLCDPFDFSGVFTPGVDTLKGGDGKDLLHGGGLGDHLYGGADSDLFAWEHVSHFADTIYDMTFGAAGDRLWFGHMIQPQNGLGFADYVSLTTDNGDTLLWLDRDGTGPLAKELVARLDATAPGTLNLAQLPGFVTGAGSLTVPLAGAPVLLQPVGAVGTYWADSWNLTAGGPGFGSYFLLDGNDTVVTELFGSYCLGKGDDTFSVAPGALFEIGVAVNGDEGSDTITGSQLGDTLTGGSGADSLVGGGGNDELRGDCFDCSLVICGREHELATSPFGSFLNSGFGALLTGGIDTIRGGEGDDVIIGGFGPDDLDGGPGNDLFVYEFISDFGDLIRNFEVGADRILLNALIRLAPGADSAASYVTALPNGANTELWFDLDAGGSAFAPQLLATLVGVNAASFNVAANVLLGEEFRASWNNQPSGGVTITGDPIVGQTLTATNDIGDPDGLGPIGYQWQSSGDAGATWSPIGGATTDMLTLTAGLVGMQVRALANYTDGGGTGESVPSASTVPVVAMSVNQPPESSNGAVDATEDVTFDGTLPAATDANGDPITYALAQQSVHGAASISPNGAFQWTPTGNYFGADFFLFEVSDGKGGSNQYRIDVNVAEVVDTIDGTAGNDNLVDGTGGRSLINGLAGNDTLTGGSHDDTLDGGAGIDAGVFAGNRANYVVTLGTTPTVAALSGDEGTDTLNATERVFFADGKLAIDLDAATGNAGIVAQYIGAVFGPPEVANQAFVGIGLYFADTGMSQNDLMALALGAALGPGFTNPQLITLLYQNLVGVTPSPADIVFWEGVMAATPYTQVGLAQFAATNAINTNNIDLAGLQTNGLPYIEYIV